MNKRPKTPEELLAFKKGLEYVDGKPGARPMDPTEFLDQRKHALRPSVDENGQPKNLKYREKDVGIRQVDELIGLLKGIISDQSLVTAEVHFLHRWLDSNTFASKDWPGSAINQRIIRALSDGVIDDAEILEIYELINKVVNGGLDEYSKSDLTTSLPLDDNPPAVVFSEKIFCFTGKLIWGTRQAAELAVLDRGGKIAKPSSNLNYLVLGEIGSRDWKHSTHGLKILNAVRLKEKGAGIFIITEKHWAKYLSQP